MGVHMLFSGGFASEVMGGSDMSSGVWKDGEERECRFVFIGKELKQKHAEKLRRDFLGCAAEEPLRFKVGDKVQAQVGAPRQEENQWVGSHRFAIVRQGGVEEVVGKSPFHTGQGEFTETSFFNSAGVACAVGSLKLRLKASSFVQGVVLHIQHWKVLTLSMAGKLLYRFLFEFCR